MTHDYTYDELARNYQLWGEYVDPLATMTEQEFNETSHEERVQIIVDCFGPEADCPS